MRNRDGATSVAELVMVSVLFAVVLGGVARMSRDQARLSALQRDRIRFEEAVRTASVILGAELRLLAAADFVAHSPDSLRIRAFRGGGPVCGGDAASLRIEYAGTRDPDPERDSVLVVGAGADQVLALTGVRRSSDCGGSMELSVQAETEVATGYALVFETGAFHLNDSALRYLRGAGGRQPLTEPVLSDLAFQGAAARMGLRMSPHPDSLPRLSGAPRSIVFTSLNRADEP